MSNWKQVHLPCPSPDCGSSDAYSIDNQDNGYCFSCGYYSHGGQEDSQPLSKEALELNLLGHFSDLPERKISQKTAEFFGVKTTNGSWIFPYPTEDGSLSAQKERLKDNKIFFWRGDTKSAGLFGMSKYSSGNTITITEGEFDAMAFKELCGDYPVVSVKNGAKGAVEDIKKNLEYFKNFQKVYICLDSDEAGKKAATLVAELFPIGKVKIVNLRHHKDANEYLMAGHVTEFKKCWWNAVDFTPAGIEAAKEGGFESLFEEVDDLELFPYPYDLLNETTFGLRKGEMVTVVAGTGVGKTWGKGTEILMFSGEIKSVEDIKVGDLVMGPDSFSRKVISTHIVKGQEYIIKQKKSKDIVCNGPHILCLWNSKTKKYFEISAEDYFNSKKSVKNVSKIYRKPVERFENSKDNFDLDPYFLGLWLGDGDKNSQRITTTDKEVVEFLENFAKSLDCSMTNYDISYTIKKSKGKPNPVKEMLKKWNLIGNKHIPFDYLTASKLVRLEVLAGLIDSDGYVHNNSIEISQKSKVLTENIEFLARSLGYFVSVRKKHNKKFNKDYYRIGIYGEDLNKIPTKIPRKKLNPRKQIKNALVTGFKIEKGKKDSVFYGFELDGDKKHLLGDFVVAHNSAFISETAFNLLQTTDKKIGMLLLEENTKKTKLRFMSLFLNKPLHLTLLGKLADKFKFLEGVLDKLFSSKEDWKFDASTKKLLEKAWNEVIEKKAHDGEPQLWLFNHFGSNNIDTIVSRIDAMVTGLGCEFIFLDHISIVVSDQQNADERKALDELATKLRTLVEQRNFSLVIVSHLRRPGGKPHEEGGETSLSDIRGTAGIGQLSDIVIGLERNGQYPDEYLRNVTKMRVLKNRFSGITGLTSYAHYDITTGRLLEVDKDIVDEMFERESFETEEPVFDNTEIAKET